MQILTDGTSPGGEICPSPSHKTHQGLVVLVLAAAFVFEIYQSIRGKLIDPRFSSSTLFFLTLS